MKRKKKKSQKYKKIRLQYVLILILTGLIILGYISSTCYFKKKNFFKEHPEGVVIWELPAEDMIVSVADKFLGKDVEIQIHYILDKGSYWKIAKENEVDVDTILGCNPYLTSIYASIGEKIIAVNKRGVIHYIQGEEDMDILSKLYNVKKAVIRKNNKIGIFGGLTKGDILFIPGAKPKIFTEKMYKWIKKRRMFVVPTSGWAAGGSFGWRIHPILKKKKFHKGIDMKTARGTLVKASAAGVVAASGSGGTYGKVIIINHADGYQTRYAHLSRIFVRTGQKVVQGQWIGRVGNTGLSTTSHLHFEIRKNGRPINPMKFLW